MDFFLDGVIAGYGIAIPVGAIAVLIVGIGMRSGLRNGLSAAAGAAAANLVYAIIAMLSGRYSFFDFLDKQAHLFDGKRLAIRSA